MHVTPPNTDDTVPSEEEIERVVREMKPHKVGGKSGMKTDHFKQFLARATRQEKPNCKEWDELVHLVQQIFETG